MTPIIKDSFGVPARVLIDTEQSVSWAGMTIPLIACAAIWGIGDAAAANAAWLTGLHSVIGAAASAWTVLRFVRRRISPRPPQPAALWASASLPILYGLLVAQPLLAAAGSMLHGGRARLFGIKLPTILPVDQVWAGHIDQLHGWNALLLLLLIAAHIAATLSTVRQPRLTRL